MIVIRQQCNNVKTKFENDINWESKPVQNTMYSWEKKWVGGTVGPPYKTHIFFVWSTCKVKHIPLMWLV